MAPQAEAPQEQRAGSRPRLPVRGAHAALAGVVAVVLAVGALERRPAMTDDFDPVRRSARTRSRRRYFAIDICSHSLILYPYSQY